MFTVIAGDLRAELTPIETRPVLTSTTNDPRTALQDSDHIDIFRTQHGIVQHKTGYEWRGSAYRWRGIENPDIPGLAECVWCSERRGTRCMLG